MLAAEVQGTDVLGKGIVMPKMMSTGKGAGDVNVDVQCNDVCSDVCTPVPQKVCNEVPYQTQVCTPGCTIQVDRPHPCGSTDSVTI